MFFDRDCISLPDTIKFNFFRQIKILHLYFKQKSIDTSWVTNQIVSQSQLTRTLFLLS